MHLSIIIPIYNEKDNIHNILQRLSPVCEKISTEYELIFINDGSKDNSYEIIKLLAESNPHIKYINFSRNFGHQAAVSAGLDLCSGENVVIIDADLQDPPELILEMYAKVQEGYDVVYAKRNKREGESFFKLLTAKYFYRTLNAITSVDIPLDTGDFRIMKKSVVNVVKNMPEKNKFLRGQIAWVGFKQTYVEYNRDQRLAGETGYTLKKMLKLSMDGITSFSAFPLRVATWMGFIVSFISFILIIYALYSRFISNEYQSGWASIIISVLFIGGVQLMCIGIIGEYISRIFDNVRDRPLYIIKEKNF